MDRTRYSTFTLKNANKTQVLGLLEAMDREIRKVGSNPAALPLDLQEDYCWVQKAMQDKTEGSNNDWSLYNANSNWSGRSN